MKINNFGEYYAEAEVAFTPKSWYTDEDGVIHYTDVKLQYVSIDREPLNITFEQMKNAEELMKKLDKRE